MCLGKLPINTSYKLFYNETRFIQNMFTSVLELFSYMDIFELRQSKCEIQIPKIKKNFK